MRPAAGVPLRCPEEGSVSNVLSPGRKFLTQKDKESIFTMDHFPLWYRRAAEHPPGSFIYSIVSEDESGNPRLNTEQTEGKRKKLFSHLTSHTAPIPIPLSLPPA